MNGVVIDEGMLNRARGCLLGQVAGDNLGGLVEFRGGPEVIARLYPDGVRQMRDGGTWGIMAGQATDDSELALALARSIVASGTYDRAASYAAGRTWLASHPFDVGGTTYAGFTGCPSADSESNGSLMRVSPIGIWGAGRPDGEVAAAARADASLLHAHPVPQACNELFAVGIAHAIRGASAQAVYDIVAARALERDVPATVLAAIDGARTSRPRFVSCMGWVLIAFRNALWQLLHANSVEEAVVDTIAHAGDTDTNAAICGALLGAVHGADSLPPFWRETIRACRPGPSEPRTTQPRPEEYWPCDVEELAQALVATGMGAHASGPVGILR